MKDEYQGGMKMADYISKHEAYTKLKDLEAAYINPPVKEAYGTAARHIDQIKPADVQPIKHGYWIKQPEKFQIYEDVINSNYLYSCSCCNASDLHSERANNDGEVKFCWRCGARMDAEPDEPWQSE